MSFHYDYIKKYPKSNNYKLGVINYVFNNNINLNKIDFIMILDDLVNNKLLNKYSKDNIEVVIYGVINRINKYYDKLKYII